MLYTKLTLKNIPRPVFAHVYSCPGYKTRFKKMAPNIEIAYIKTGGLTIYAEETEFTAKENGFLILPHQYTFTAEGSSACAHVHYTISAMVDKNCVLVDSYPDKMEDDELCIPLYIPANSKSEEMAKLLYKAISMYHKNDSISKLKCGSLVAQLLCELGEAASVSEEKQTGKKTEIMDNRIKSYIEKNLNSKINLSDIGEVMGKNANYLNQVFKRINHMSIISYANLMKMKKVAELIVDKGYTVKDAAKEVGIKDVNYLSRLFKQKMGMSISDFRDNSADYTFDFTDKDKII